MFVTIKGLLPSAYHRITKDLAPSRWCKKSAKDIDGWEVILDESVILKVNGEKLWIDCHDAMTYLEASEFVEVTII